MTKITLAIVVDNYVTLIREIKYVTLIREIKRYWQSKTRLQRFLNRTQLMLRWDFSKTRFGGIPQKKF